MQCQNLFSGKLRKNINLSSAKLDSLQFALLVFCVADL